MLCDSSVRKFEQPQSQTWQYPYGADEEQQQQQHPAAGAFWRTMQQQKLSGSSQGGGSVRLQRARFHVEPRAVCHVSRLMRLHTVSWLQNIWTRIDKLMTHDVCGPGTFGIFQKEFGENAQVQQ